MFRRRAFITVMCENWQSVAAPVGWTWELPFTIQQSGRSFRVDPSFNLQTRAAITVTGTYYVDSATGSDSNTGAEWGSALKTMNAAYGKADVNRIYCRGYWYRNQTWTSLPDRSVEIIGVGTAQITSDFSNTIGAWLAVDNHYEATNTSDAAYSVRDAANPDAFGQPSRLTQKTTIAEVDATPGSFFTDHGGAGKLYVRTIDDRAPDADIIPFAALALDISRNSNAYYLENLIILGHIRVRNLSATGGLKAYIKDCTLRSVGVEGCEEFIAQDCTSADATQDTFTYDPLNGVITKSAEINCHFYNCGYLDENQCSSPHTDGLHVRVGGRYHDATGQLLSDTCGQVWMLGTEFYNAGALASGIGMYARTTAWLDCCYSHDNTTDIQLASTAIVNKRNLISGGVFIIDPGGVLQDY